MKKRYVTVPLLFICLVFYGNSALCQIPTTWSNQTIPAGSKIIDMGVTPQTIANGLLPYGLVYDLLKNYSTPVLWAINPSKSKDGTDFIQDGITYKGGPFIIKAGYLTSSVTTAINSWISDGVIVRTTTTSGSIPIFKELNQAPLWVLATDNSTIPSSFMTDANIPTSAFSVASSSTLNACNNIFVMPHADPTWATHSSLYSWTKSIDSTNGFQGWLWTGCHAASVLEGLSNPSVSWQKMNFLTNTGLVNYGSHHDGSTPYINDSFPSNPLMQFISTIDAATVAGSEQIYMPSLGGGWRSTTKLGVYDLVQQDVPGLSPGYAAPFVFGPAKGDYNAGYVAYEAGHNVSGNKTWNVAAERLFFNFSFLAPAMQTRVFTINSVNIPDTFYTGNTITLSVNVSGNTGPYTYQWSSTCTGAAFTAPTSATTNLTIPPNTGTCIVKVVVSNACTKATFSSKAVTLVNYGVLPLQLASYGISYLDPIAKLNWKVNDEAGAISYLIERSLDGSSFNTAGTVAADPSNHGLYHFDDATVNAYPNEMVYYRIRQVTNSNQNKVSPVMVLRKVSQYLSRLSIQPNPAHNFITVDFSSNSSGVADLLIFNSAGVPVKKKAISFSAGMSKIFIDDLDKFPSGMYTVFIKTDKESVGEKFFIVN